MIFLLERLGGCRSNLMWRGIGASAVAGFLHDYHWSLRILYRSVPLDWEIFRQYLAARTIADHTFSLCGFLLLFFGPRLLLLALTGTSAAMILWRNFWHTALFPAVEFPLYVVLPLFTIAALAVEYWSDKKHARLSLPGDWQKHCDAVLIQQVRIALLSTMFFVTFHKLNQDFFNPETSCVGHISEGISKAWGWVGEVYTSFGSPLLTVIVEGVLPLLLMTIPWLGNIAAGVFFLPLGLFGAAQIVILSMSMGWAFISHRDAEVLRRDRWPITAMIITLSALAIIIALQIYQRPNMSRELMSLVEITAITTIVGGAWILRDRFSRGPSALLGNGDDDHVPMKLSRATNHRQRLRFDGLLNQRIQSLPWNKVPLQFFHVEQSPRRRQSVE